MQNPAVQKQTKQTYIQTNMALPTYTLHSPFGDCQRRFDQRSHIEQVDMIARTYAAVQYAV